MSESPFSVPPMECRECGRAPHDGYCDPVLDRFLTVLIVLVVCVCVPVLVVVFIGL